MTRTKSGKGAARRALRESLNTGSTPTEASTSATARPKKVKKPKKHPPISEMAINAIKTLNEPGGSSLTAIVKFMNNEYQVDADKLKPFIIKYLKSAFAQGRIFMRGQDASAFFKVPATANEEVKHVLSPEEQQNSEQ